MKLEVTLNDSMMMNGIPFSEISSASEQVWSYLSQVAKTKSINLVLPCKPDVVNKEIDEGTAYPYHHYACSLVASNVWMLLATVRLESGSRMEGIHHLRYIIKLKNNFFKKKNTPPKFNIAPEKVPSQKESSLGTIVFQGLW